MDIVLDASKGVEESLFQILKVKPSYENIQDIDTKVAENVQQASGAIGGIVGQALFSEWSENCVPLLNFKRYFEDIKGRISTIYNATAEAYNASMGQYATDQNGNATEGITTGNSDVYSVYGNTNYNGSSSITTPLLFMS